MLLVLTLLGIAIVLGLCAAGAAVGRRYWLCLALGLTAVLALGGSLLLLAPPEFV